MELHVNFGKWSAQVELLAARVRRQSSSTMTTISTPAAVQDWVSRPAGGARTSTRATTVTGQAIYRRLTGINRAQIDAVHVNGDVRALARASLDVLQFAVLSWQQVAPN
jgi:hypothetical protein